MTAHMQGGPRQQLGQFELKDAPLALQRGANGLCEGRSAAEPHVQRMCRVIALEFAQEFEGWAQPDPARGLGVRMAQEFSGNVCEQSSRDHAEVGKRRGQGRPGFLAAKQVEEGTRLERGHIGVRGNDALQQSQRGVVVSFAKREQPAVEWGKNLGVISQAAPRPVNFPQCNIEGIPAYGIRDPPQDSDRVSTRGAAI